MKVITIRGILLKNNFDIIKVVYPRARPPYDIIEQKFNSSEFFTTNNKYLLYTNISYIYTYQNKKGKNVLCIKATKGNSRG